MSKKIKARMPFGTFENMMAVLDHEYPEPDHLSFEVRITVKPAKFIGGERTREITATIELNPETAKKVVVALERETEERAGGVAGQDEFVPIINQLNTEKEQ